MIFTQYYKPLLCKGRANGLRYRRGGLAKLSKYYRANLANRAANLGAIAPSGARFVRRLFFLYICHHNIF